MILEKIACGSCRFRNLEIVYVARCLMALVTAVCGFWSGLLLGRLSVGTGTAAILSPSSFPLYCILI